MKKDLFVSHGSTLRALIVVAKAEMDALTRIKLKGDRDAGPTIGDRLLTPVKVSPSD